MLLALRQLICDTVWPPPVQWIDIINVVNEIDRVDVHIELVRAEQSKTSDAYRFATMEFEVETLLQRRSTLCRLKRSMLARARSQGPQVDVDQYERLV